MNRVKRIAILCLPWFLAACSTMQFPAPVQEATEPSLVSPSVEESVVKSNEKPKEQAKPAPVDNVAQAPAAVTALLKRAQQQRRDGNQQAAAASLERAIRIAPRYPESYFRLGELRYQQEIYDQARSLAEKALSLGADLWLRRQAQSLAERASAAQ